MFSEAYPIVASVPSRKVSRQNRSVMDVLPTPDLPKNTTWTGEKVGDGGATGKKRQKWEREKSRPRFLGSSSQNMRGIEGKCRERLRGRKEKGEESRRNRAEEKSTLKLVLEGDALVLGFHLMSG